MASASFLIAKFALPENHTDVSNVANKFNHRKNMNTPEENSMATFGTHIPAFPAQKLPTHSTATAVSMVVGFGKTWNTSWEN